MDNRSLVYDLGSLEPAPPLRPVAAPQTVAEPAAKPPAGFDWRGSLSLFLPGSGRLLGGRTASGLFFICSLGFLVALGWAVLATIDRLSGTLEVLGYARAASVWALAVIYVAAATLHVANLLGAERTAFAGRPHPAVAGIASLLVPGWGQVLNGDRIRAASFVGMLWVGAAAWILAAPQTAALFESLRLYMPDGIALLASPAVRWTVPPVVWALAVYDAVSSATK